MGDVKDLEYSEAIKKIQDLVKSNETCLFCTDLKADGPFATRPMSTQLVDDDGNFWFLSDKNSNKNWQLQHNDHVQLLYNADGHSSFLSIYGQAEISQDRQKIKELWEPIVKAWFKEGQDDPNISVIKVVPEEGYYWDTKHGKMVSFLKILGSMVTGNRSDDGIEGKVTL